MEIVTRKGEGLFPSPTEISLSCSCPDWASMCKHVAATLYGVGARLDREPELLFTLRGVDPTEMVEAAIKQPPRISKSRKGRVLASDELSSVFGVDIDMDGVSSDVTLRATKPPKRTRSATKARKSAAPKVTKKTKAKPTTTITSAIAKRATANTKTTPKKAAAKKSNTKKPTAKKPAAKKVVAKTSSAKKSTTEKTTPRKATAKKKTTTGKQVSLKKKKSQRKPATKKAKR
jgi:uncharacterized Zn finger protein